MIFFGQASLQHAIRHFMAHYPTERNHQGLGNHLLQPVSSTALPHHPIQRRQRLKREAQRLPSRSSLRSVDPVSGQFAINRTNTRLQPMSALCSKRLNQACLQRESIQDITPSVGERMRSCPRAGCGNGATVRQLRHRQTKGAATVATSLPPPRHISTPPRITMTAFSPWPAATSALRFTG
jgi:hypothetical protein